MPKPKQWNKHLLWMILVFFTTTTTGWGQFYETGTLPFFTQWQVIKTEHFKVIFPSTAYTAANKMAGTLEKSYSATTASMSATIRNFPVILNNQSALSNGYVVWAPRRMEIVTTPPQRSYSQSWIDQLALHEFRHVAQINSLNSGLTNFLRYPFGQMATGGMLAFVPLWFLEGDAVVNETALTSSGRGRQACFQKEIRALEQSGKRYSYDQSYLGSYRYFIPDHYRYGYQLTSYARKVYGEDIWSSVMKNVGRKPFTFAPFYIGLKRYDLSKVKLYHQSLDDFSKQINTFETDGSQYASESIIPTPANRKYTSYTFPVLDANNRLYALKSGIDDIHRIVEITNGNESLLHTPGLLDNTKITAGGKYLAWEEIIPDIRWEKRDYRVVKFIDLETKRVRALERKKRQFSPSISRSGASIVVVESSPDYVSSLCVYQLPNRKVLYKISRDDNGQFSYPVFLNDSVVYALVQEDVGKSIWKIHLESGKQQRIFGPVTYSIGQLCALDDQLVFASDYSGIDELYSIDCDGAQMKRITRSNHGDYYPFYHPSDKSIYYASYTIDGFILKKSELSTGIALAKVPQGIFENAEAIQRQEGYNVQTDTTTLRKYVARRYNRWTNAVLPHSWIPFFYIDTENTQAIQSGQLPVYPGATVFLQNQLSTLLGSVSYYYKDGYHHFKPAIKLQALYPVFELSADFGGEPLGYVEDSVTNIDRALLQDFFTLQASVSIPINFTRSRFYVRLQPKLKYERDNYNYIYKDAYYYGRSYLYGEFSASVNRKMSQRNLLPRWGLSLFMSYGKASAKKFFLDDVSFVSGTIYLPGIGRNHSLNFYGGHQNRYHWNMLPRGLQEPSYSGLLKLHTFTLLRSNYTLPLVYPDLSLAPLIYCNRIRLTAFYDQLWYTEPLANRSIDHLRVTTGLELSADTHLLRFYYPFLPRYQLAYDLYTQKIAHSFSIQVPFSN